MQGMWRIAFEVPERLVPLFADVVEPHLDAVSTFELQEGGQWLIEGTSYTEPDTARIAMKLAVLAAAQGIPEPELTKEPLPPIDWVTKTYLSFPPITAGRFFIHGSHHKKPVPKGKIGLQIEAAMAFGSGEHATTQGCLRAISELCKVGGFRNALDMGCGSGILAFALAKLRHIPVVGVDIDALSIEIAQENAVLNRVHKLVSLHAANGYAAKAVREFGKFDLIVANILARPLARMAPDLRRHLVPGGTAIFSGLLHHQEPLVINAHRTQGLRLVRRFRLGDWSTLVMKG
ncbi:50S ribosomal protein L11 methyltransferase [Aerophototrophica crusticola]|uniref:Ribosomal protein L11 methyltransferase n=1 Tax=Aerophototrophica crusticola TaxID=1709002 RepID=A0A858R3G0_9PROT|nr:50S ribosomal protein L11 methyltransferase [Rhodospirillaceae bacterium B3]